MSCELWNANSKNFREMGSESNARVNPEKVPLETDQGILESEQIKWGLPLKDVYKYGLAFYKDKEGKALHLSYEDKLKLVAYTQQAANGPLNLASAPPLGVLDVIGRDRRAAWQALGLMSQIQAMAGFVHNLDRLSASFKPYLEAILKDLEHKKNQESRKENDEKAYDELQKRVMMEKHNQDSNKLSEEQQVQRIKDALNAQTYEQFLQYAQQQYPGNFDQQAVLIRQLQDQHYHSYIQQLAVDKRIDDSNMKDDKITEKDACVFHDDSCNLNSTGEGCAVHSKSLQTLENSELNEFTDETKEEESDGDGYLSMDAPHMWTHGNIVQFKESALASGGKLTVGHGETVTVRVPTHQRARCLCWEFATDNYDIGFGLYFEWSKPLSTDVTIHVSESDEEEDGEEDDDGFNDDVFRNGADPELGSHEQENAALNDTKIPVSMVVPIFRRDCHNEVYGGSHTYPGEGVYLLKFDNTYSLWRSKTLYYKVYYTQ